MNETSKPARTHSRGVTLTEEALKLVDRELTKQWRNSNGKQFTPTGRIQKLSRDIKKDLLELNEKTIDKLYRREPLDEITLKHVFEKLNIQPPFSKERYCVPPPPPSHSPTPTTSFIGRETEIAEIKTLLEANSLVTLTGPGGVGKTRLAVQVAEEMKSEFAAGIRFVDLTGLPEAADQVRVLQVIATALGVKEEKQRSLTETLTDFLRDKSLLLILDNCEHLLPACAPLTRDMLSASASLKVLATSREPLNIPSERSFPVPSLSVPDSKKLSGEVAEALVREYAAIRLFVERAKLQQPDFTVTNQNARLVASICRRLDGIPLALELAAGRTGTMPLDVLERGLNDCFHLLTDGNRAALPRHQTLHATMDWSYNLLEEKEQALLRRLAVFADGWQSEAAVQVCGGDGIKEEKVPNLLKSLIQKNLVVSEKRDEEPERYRLLETVRQYAGGKLWQRGESNAIQGWHRDYFLVLAEEAALRLPGTEQEEWLERLEDEHANLNAALDRSLSEAGQFVSLRFCWALHRFWHTRGYLSEGLNWCVKTLQKPEAQERTPARAKVLNAAGLLAYYQADYVSAVSCYEEGLALYREIGDKGGLARSLYGLGLVVLNQGDPMATRILYEESRALCQEIKDQVGMARAFNGLGSVAEYQGDYDSARSYYEQSVLLFRELGDQSNLANSLKNLGSVTYHLGDYEAARSFFEEGLSLFRKSEDQSGIAYALSGLGLIDHAQGNYEAACLCFESSLSVLREIGDQGGIAYSLSNLGNLAQDQGDYEVARPFFEESLTLFGKIKAQSGIATSLEAFARLAAKESKTKRAALLWGAAAVLRAKSGSSMLPGERNAYTDALATVRQALDEKTFSATWARGGSLSLEQAIEYALAGTED